MPEETSNPVTQCELAGCQNPADGSRSFTYRLGENYEGRTVKVCEWHYELIGGKDVRDFSIGRKRTDA